MSTPKSIFGAALLGMSFDDAETVTEVLNILKDCGVTQIDTAPRYPPFEPGKSEDLLGEAQAVSKGFLIDSKVLAKPGGGGELETESLTNSIANTLTRLGSKQLEVFYCHKWDPKTPLEEQTAGLDKNYKEGLFKKELGVVGFEPDQLQAFLDVASKHNRVKPTVYQGEYNILTRGLEKKILPLLRANGVSYYAHCPLAAGFLTGKFTNDRHAGTRFATDHPLHKVFHDRYDVPALHEAVKTLERVGESRGISVRDASLRWIFYHSALRGDDGVITGCTTLEQIRENAESVARGSLPDDMVKVAEEIWNALSASRGDLL